MKRYVFMVVDSGQFRLDSKRNYHMYDDQQAYEDYCVIREIDETGNVELALAQSDTFIMEWEEWSK